MLLKYQYLWDSVEWEIEVGQYIDFRVEEPSGYRNCIKGCVKEIKVTDRWGQLVLLFQQ